MPDQQKLARLQELLANAYDHPASLRAMLEELPSLDVVRIIEGAAAPTEKAESPA